MQENKKTSITKEQIVPTAEKMRADGVMLVMIHAYFEEDGTPVVTYEYGQGPTLESYEVRGEKVLPDIAPIYDQAAAWPEREISELMDITFSGLDTAQRLFMPDNLLDGKGQILVTPLDELRKANVDARADGKQ
jgi:Ni,Fe-hydrogenase III component G